jgi:biopolymer transport protein ExbD
MRKRRSKIAAAEPEELPVSSFSDIAFLLIIFFILVTSLTQTMGFTTEIPAGEKSEEQQDKSASVALREGKIFFNDAPVTPTELRDRLLELQLPAKEKDEEKMVILEAHGRVDYQTYFTAMSTIAEAGGVVAIVKEEK